jgi:hypothetical protein
MAVKFDYHLLDIKILKFLIQLMLASACKTMKLRVQLEQLHR